MTRVSTSSNFSIMTTNLMRAQLTQGAVGEQVSSQKVANDLKGYARNAEVLTAMRSTQAKLNGLLDQTTLVSNRLEMQDTGIGKIASGAKGGREAIANAMAAGNATTLMQQLKSAFGDVLQGLNTKSNGRYVFAGAQTDTPPTSATSMADLTAAAATSDLFHNDQYIATNRVDEQTTTQTGILGDALGTSTFEAFKQMQAYVDANGPFTGTLTSSQNDFLKSMLPSFDSAYSDIVTIQGKNGLSQKRFETAKVELQDQTDTLTTMIGGITDVDMAEAVTRLEAAKLAVQASAQVFAGLQTSSLLNYLK
ncbi:MULTISPECIES: flagellin [unclassified Caulobacter]|uniref:flagellin n=1 Tax=unclassified Caulobacter TaxID=2648921 RepID=UPI000D33B871|nr:MULTISPECIES: flagellin [unclassified Caulobacter]PTS89666.1 flagellin [Caulobacter sp. HMWF009]PTT11089.1 flagellin [Caulobacter sp. HMWF025]PTT75316.1 flagellin [Pseudomonas sp. HMWF010]